MINIIIEEISTNVVLFSLNLAGNNSYIIWLHGFSHMDCVFFWSDNTTIILVGFGQHVQTKSTSEKLK